MSRRATDWENALNHRTLQQLASLHKAPVSLDSISDASTPNLPGLAIRYRPGRTTRTRGRRPGRGSRLGRLEPHLGRFLTVRSANEVRVGRTITF